MPKMGDAMTEGRLLRWTMENGAQVKPGDIIAEIETDKSNVEVEAEDAGILSIFTLQGETVPVGFTIGSIGASLVKSPTTAAPPVTKIMTPSAPPAPTTKSSATAASNGQERIKASPLARRVARESGLDIAGISGSGPYGRIVEADVKAHLSTSSAKAPPTSPRVIAAHNTIPAASPVELSAIRRVIARRMVQSKTTIPHFYISSEIDMDAAVALREKLNSYDEALPKISVNDLVVKATALALQKVPAANAAYRDDKIVHGDGIHVGIAVALDEGLIVPVVRHANTLPLRKLAAASRELINKARAKKLNPDEYSGGTFTVSNMGAFDVEEFLAIIDPSQGAILAVASILKKPVVLADGVTIGVGQRLMVTFSGDHRIMDGATGASFLQELKRILHNPLSLLEA